MSPEEHKSLLRDLWFPAMVSRDLKVLGALMSDDFELWLPETIARSIPKPRPVKGRAAGLGIFDHAAGEFFDCESRRWTYHSFVADGAYVSVHATMTAKTVIGDDYVNDYHFLFRFAGGKVSEFWEFNDTQYNLDLVRRIAASRSAS